MRPGEAREERRTYVVTIDDVYPDLVVGAGLGIPNAPRVQIHRPPGGSPLAAFTAYGVSAWGANVAAGDPTGDGFDEALTGPGPGDQFGAHVRAFDRTGAAMGKMGGRFTTAGGVQASYVAQWDGASWSSLGSGMNGPVHALASDGSGLYAGGRFWVAGGVAAKRVARWDGTTFQPPRSRDEPLRLRAGVGWIGPLRGR